MKTRLCITALLFLLPFVGSGAVLPSSQELCDPYQSNPIDLAACISALPNCLQGNNGSGVVKACLAKAVTESNSPRDPPGNAGDPPPPPGGNNSKLNNRAVNWNARKYNNSLFNQEANNNAQFGAVRVSIDPSGGIHTANGGGLFVNQKDAFQNQNDLLLACATTHILGRHDPICANTPNDPECTGMNAALGYAVTCVLQGPWDPIAQKFTCLAFGAYGFTLNEWLVFGQQYYNGMSACLNSSSGTDTTGLGGAGNIPVDRQNRLSNLTDIVAFTPPGGVSANTSGASQSTITGKLSKEANKDVPFWKEISEKLDDGASFLGLDKGELIKKALLKQSFLSTFSESPFAENLKKNIREDTELALANPADTFEKAQQKRLAQTDENKSGPSAGEGIVRDIPPLMANGESLKLGNSQMGNTPGAGSPKQGESKTASRAPASVEEIKSGLVPLGQIQLPSTNANFPNGFNRDSKREGPIKISSELNGNFLPPDGAYESSLFYRISALYRKRALQFKVLEESRTARDVRLTEKPAAFEGL